MGWKAVKQHYNIGHIVHVRDDTICIGSGYISDILVINATGTFIKKSEHLGVTTGELGRYVRDIEADPAKYRELLAVTDTFAADVVVYTFDYDKGDVAEKLCETPDYPNLTHDGCLMSDAFSTNKDYIIAKARRNEELRIDMTNLHIRKLERQIEEARADVARSEATLAKLAVRYPVPENKTE